MTIDDGKIKDALSSSIVLGNVPSSPEKIDISSARVH